MKAYRLTRSLLLLLLASIYSLYSTAIEVPRLELLKGPQKVEDAFDFRYENSGNGKWRLDWAIDQYYYLYLEKFAFESNDPTVTFHKEFSKNIEPYKDPFFGDIDIFRNYVTVDLTINAPAGTEPGPFIVTYQGCWDGGVCYPPQKITLRADSYADLIVVPYNDSNKSGENLSTNNAPRLAAQPEQNAQPSLNMADVIINESDQRPFTNLLNNGTLWLIVAVFFVAGLALAFTPCVFPAIPLVVGVISRQASSLTSMRGAMMMAVFVLCMSLTYALAGMVAGLLGKNLQAFLQQDWIVIISALLFIFLAGAMFGLYNLQLPAGVTGWLTKISNKPHHGTYYGMAVMGVFSALIVGPCLTAPLAGILVYLSSKGDPVLGAISLFVLGLGMGMPLLIFGFFAKTLLPKAGEWMSRVQHFFGFAMLLLTVWMLDRVVADDIVLLLYALVIICFGSYLLYLARLSKHADRAGAEIVFRSAAIVLLIFGVIQIVGYALGSKNVVQPLKLLQREYSTLNSFASGQKPTSQIITTPLQLQQALDKNAQQNTRVVLKYEADWCIDCKIINREVFNDLQVLSTMASVATIIVDVTKSGEDSDFLLKKYNLFGPPAIVFYDANGKQRDELTLQGNITKSRVLKNLRQL